MSQKVLQVLFDSFSVLSERFLFEVEHKNKMANHKMTLCEFQDFVRFMIKEGKGIVNSLGCPGLRPQIDFVFYFE